MRSLYGVVRCRTTRISDEERGNGMMRQRFVQVLKSEEQDSLEAEVLKRFWARAKPLPARVENRPEARVVDLAQWAASRRSDNH
jgi:hypothetical protein